MLCISRRNEEELIIGTGNHATVVRVLESHEGKVRLGITAPRDIQVDREEVRRRKEEARP